MDGGEELTSRTPLTPEAEKKYRATVLGGVDAEARGVVTDDAVHAASAKDSRKAGAIPQLVERLRISQRYPRAVGARARSFLLAARRLEHDLLGPC
jgi:hypothetical protein